MKTARRLPILNALGKRFLTEELNRTAEAPGRNRGETLTEIKTFKSSCGYGGIWKKHTHTSPGKIPSMKRFRTLSMYAGLISEGFPRHSQSVKTGRLMLEGFSEEWYLALKKEWHWAWWTNYWEELQGNQGRCFPRIFKSHHKSGWWAIPGPFSQRRKLRHRGVNRLAKGHRL